MARTKTCKACGGKFTPVRFAQVVCNDIQCALAYAKAKGDKLREKRALEEAREHRAKKLKAKTRTQWEKDAEQAVNAWVRWRDRNDGCISCDKPSTWQGQWHASHWRSAGSASSIRFNLFNIHKSCSVCNAVLSGNLHGYTPRLIEKIGQDRVDWLRSQNSPVRFEIDYLKRLRDVFRKKLRLAKRRAGVL